MELELIRGIWGYHWWGNRKHFDEVAALGEESARKEVGTQFSFPTLKGMLAHIYGVDRTWLERWKGTSPTRIYGDADFASLAELRKSWDSLEAEQKAFISGLGRRTSSGRWTTSRRTARPAASRSGISSSTSSTTRPITAARSRPWCR